MEQVIYKEKGLEITIEDVESVEKIHNAYVGTKIASEGYEEVAKELSGNGEIMKGTYI